MTKLQLFALFFIAGCAGPTWAAGSNVYKCGATYSQTPCDGAVALRVDDARSKEQKSQSDATIIHQGQAANAMEKTRLKEDALAIAQSKPARSTEKPNAKTKSKTKADTDTADKHKSSKGRKKESEFFTAKEANPDKKK